MMETATNTLYVVLAVGLKNCPSVIGLRSSQYRPKEMVRLYNPNIYNDTHSNIFRDNLISVNSSSPCRSCDKFLLNLSLHICGSTIKSFH